MPTAHTEASLAGGSSQTTPGSNARGLFPRNAHERHSRSWNPERTAKAIDLYTNCTDSAADVLAAVNAVCADTLEPLACWRTLQSRMVYLGHLRHPDAIIAANKRRAHASDGPLITKIRDLLAEGMSRPEIAKAVGRNESSITRHILNHNLAPKRGSLPPKLKTKPPKPAKPRQVLQYAAPEPTPEPARVQTVAEWLAAGGKITRCPTVALLATQATVPASDTEAVRAYYDAKPTGNWRAQRVAEWKKAKREGRA